MLIPKKGDWVVLLGGGGPVKIVYGDSEMKESVGIFFNENGGVSSEDFLWERIEKIITDSEEIQLLEIELAKFQQTE
jgi:hypothetical protein